MAQFFTLLFLFMLGSASGWVLEFFYRRFAHGKWMNPGFLVGPCLPIYGFGVTLMYLICSIDCSFIASAAWRYVFIIVLITVIMTALEFIAGLIFMKGLKVRLWDYSDRWGNIGGMICPLFTLIWGAIGAAYFFLLHHAMQSAAAWFVSNPYLLFPLGIAYGVMILDLCYSFKVVAKIRAWAAEKNIVVRYEEFKLSIARHAEKLKQKKSWLFPFKSKNGLKRDLESYADERKKTDEKAE